MDEFLRGGGIDSSGEGGGEIGKAYSERRVLETEPGKIGHGGYVPHAAAAHPADAGSDIDFLLERKSGNLNTNAMRSGDRDHVPGRAYLGPGLVVSGSPRGGEIGHERGVLDGWWAIGRSQGVHAGYRRLRRGRREGHEGERADGYNGGRRLREDARAGRRPLRRTAARRACRAGRGNGGRKGRWRRRGRRGGGQARGRGRGWKE